MMIVSAVNDELVLYFNEDRWLVSSFVSQEKDLDLGTDNFYDDLQTLIQPNSNYKPADVLNALSDKYEWLPTLKETEKGYEQLFANVDSWW
jgi:hypothetical protein